MKFSIIIPVYNTKEDYLRKSILSVINQNYKNYELLIIDDGSNKDTKKILNEYQSDNVIVKSIKNAGVSNARNIGTKLAKGDYILYLDSDDIIAQNYLEKLNNILSNEKFDIILSQVTFNKELIYINNNYNILKDANLNDELRKYYLCFCNNKFKNKNAWVNRGPVARCLSANIAKQNQFDISLNFAEDVIWNLKLLQKDLKIAILLNPEYYYRKVLGSATQSYRKNFETELYNILSKIKECIQDTNLIDSDEYATACFEYYRIYLKLYLYHKNNNLNSFEKFTKLKEISNFIKKEMKDHKVIVKGNFKVKILYTLFKFNFFRIIHLLEMR